MKDPNPDFPEKSASRREVLGFGATASALGLAANSIAEDAAPEDWSTKRRKIEREWLKLLGDFDDLMAMVAPRALLVISSEHEFARHKFFAKVPKVIDVYANWQDAEGLPSAMKMREERLGWEETLDYYGSEYGVSEEKISAVIEKLGAGDAFSWFSFPGGHAWPGAARRQSFAWFDRWLGRTIV